jgi:hypothetical protein
MLIPVSAAGSLSVGALAWVLEQTNIFPRAVTQAAEFFHLVSQHSINEYPQAAL